MINKNYLKLRRGAAGTGGAAHWWFYYTIPCPKLQGMARNFARGTKKLCLALDKAAQIWYDGKAVLEKTPQAGVVQW